VREARASVQLRERREGRGDKTGERREERGEKTEALSHPDYRLSALGVSSLLSPIGSRLSSLLSCQ
jgi:hypothetical protein